jgi:D-2-hydroxyacid dehydrogenase (NADP+)
MKQILIAVDHFSEGHIRRIEQVVADWAEVECIPQSASPAFYRERLSTKEIVIGWPSPGWLIGSNVQLLQIGSSGWDAYQHQGLEESGIMLCTGRGVFTAGVAEHCIAMMLALVRRLPVHVHDKQDRVFRRAHPYGEALGSTACVVGFGDIGMEVAKRCKGLGMKVVAVVRDTERVYLHADAVHHIEFLKEAVAVADHVFLTATGGEENRNLFSSEILQCLRRDAYFYNVSRGTNVDEIALAELLASGRIAGAGIDVAAVEPLPPTSPLWSLGDNVLITGHSAGFSSGFPERFCELVTRNLTNFHNKHPLHNRVI